MNFASKHSVPLIGLDLESAVSSGENNPVCEDTAGAVVVELVSLVVTWHQPSYRVEFNILVLYATFQ